MKKKKKEEPPTAATMAAMDRAYAEEEVVGKEYTRLVELGERLYERFDGLDERLNDIAGHLERIADRLGETSELDYVVRAIDRLADTIGRKP